MKKSVHITQSSHDYMAARAAESEINFSAAINAAFEQLAHLAKTENPMLGDADFAEICNVYAGSDLSRIMFPINLARDLLDHHGATVPAQLPEDVRDLANQLAAMSQAQQFAVLDAVRVFWYAKR